MYNISIFFFLLWKLFPFYYLSICWFLPLSVFTTPPHLLQCFISFALILFFQFLFSAQHTCYYTLDYGLVHFYFAFFLSTLFRKIGFRYFMHVPTCPNLLVIYSSIFSSLVNLLVPCMCRSLSIVRFCICALSVDMYLVNCNLFLIQLYNLDLPRLELLPPNHRQSIIYIYI